jgi:hypothetical protein
MFWTSQCGVHCVISLLGWAANDSWVSYMEGGVPGGFWELFGWGQWTELWIQTMILLFESKCTNFFLYLIDAKLLYLGFTPNFLYSVARSNRACDLTACRSRNPSDAEREICQGFNCCSLLCVFITNLLLVECIYSTWFFPFLYYLLPHITGSAFADRTCSQRCNTKLTIPRFLSWNLFSSWNAAHIVLFSTKTFWFY